MKIHIFSVAAIAFCFAAASLSLSGGAEAGDVRLGQACKKIDQIIAPIEEQRKKIRDEWWPKQREVWTIDENAELEMEKIQVQNLNQSFDKTKTHPKKLILTKFFPTTPGHSKHKNCCKGVAISSI